MDMTKLPEIQIYFTLTDENDNSVLGVTREEITLHIDTSAQNIASLKSALEGKEYLAVGLLIDRSGSMKKALDQTKEAAFAFTKRLSMSDQIAVISFDDRVRVDSGFTKDRSLTENAINGIDLGKDTALYDAILKGVELLKEIPTQRRALVILSDGKDTKSTSQRSEALAAVKSKGISLFSIGLGPKIEENILIELSSETGGDFFKAAKAEDLLLLYQTIAEQLQNQYVLTFTSSFGRDDDWHDLHMTYKDPGGKEFGIIKRYLATTNPGVARGTLTRAQKKREAQNASWYTIIGAFFGLVLSLIILGVLKLTRPDAKLLSLAGIGLVISLTALGAIIGTVLGFGLI